MTGFADVGDQLAKMKGHLWAGIAHADFAAIPGALHGHVQTTFVPGTFSVEHEFIQSHCHGAEGGGGFALEKTKPFGQFVGNQVAQAHVIGQHHQTNALQRLRRRATHAHIAGDDGNFCLKINAKSLRDTGNRVTRADKVVAAALVHERVGVERRGHVGVARFAHQLDMVEIGRTIGPLVGAWQGGHALFGVKWEGMAQPAAMAAVECVRQVLQLRAHEVPVVQHLLHAAGDAGGVMGLAQVA